MRGRIDGGTGIFTNGGGGGGASVVSAPVLSASFNPLLIVAGGGGGGSGLGGVGGNAGAASGATGGADGLGCGGGGGTSSAGGTGGDATACGGIPGADGTSGASGIGGTGGPSGDGGGGGGGGFFGGGGGAGGAGSAGGGGGSSFVAQGALTASPTSAPAGVSITYPAPTADLSAASLSFPTQPQGTASAGQPLTVTNNGSAPLIVSGVLLSGANASDFLVGDGCQGAVAPGSSCLLAIRFDPQSTGTSSATLSLLSNAASAPGTVALSGTGGQLPQGPAGSAGSNGLVELVTCHLTTHTVVKKVHGKLKKVKVTKNVCTTETVTGPVKFITETLAGTGRALAGAASLGRRVVSR